MHNKILFSFNFNKVTCTFSIFYLCLVSIKSRCENANSIKIIQKIFELEAIKTMFFNVK